MLHYLRVFSPKFTAKTVKILHKHVPDSPARTHTPIFLSALPSDAFHAIA